VVFFKSYISWKEQRIISYQKKFDKIFSYQKSNSLLSQYKKSPVKFRRNSVVTATQMGNEMQIRRLLIAGFYHHTSVMGTLKVGQEEVTSRRTVSPFRKKRKYSTTSKHTHHVLRKEER